MALVDSLFREVGPAFIYPGRDAATTIDFRRGRVVGVGCAFNLDGEKSVHVIHFADIKSMAFEVTLVEVTMSVNGVVVYSALEVWREKADE